MSECDTWNINEKNATNRNKAHAFFINVPIWQFQSYWIYVYVKDIGQGDWWVYKGLHPVYTSCRLWHFYYLIIWLKCLPNLNRLVFTKYFFFFSNAGSEHFTNNYNGIRTPFVDSLMNNTLWVASFRICFWYANKKLHIHIFVHLSCYERDMNVSKNKLKPANVTSIF